MISTSFLLVRSKTSYKPPEGTTTYHKLPWHKNLSDQNTTSQKLRKTINYEPELEKSYKNYKNYITLLNIGSSVLRFSLENYENVPLKWWEYVTTNNTKTLPLGHVIKNWASFYQISDFKKNCRRVKENVWICPYKQCVIAILIILYVLGRLNNVCTKQKGVTLSFFSLVVVPESNSRLHDPSFPNISTQVCRIKGCGGEKMPPTNNFQKT